MSDFTVSGEFSKFDDDERLAFGWASITEIDGEPYIDRQGDFIPTTELEKAAYEYVLESRVGGEMHQKDITVRKGVETKPRQVATLVESMVFTPEKISKLGLPKDTPSGWWIGFKVHDDNVWKSVKNGKYNSFSIHGAGKRIPMEKIEKSDDDLDKFRKLIAKYGAETVAKHLIGQHEQKAHDPTKGGGHARSQHRTGEMARKGAKIGAGVLGGLAAARFARALGPSALFGGYGATPAIASGVSALKGAGLGAGAGALAGGYMKGGSKSKKSKKKKDWYQKQLEKYKRGEGPHPDDHKAQRKELLGKSEGPMDPKQARRREIVASLGNVSKDETEVIDALAEDIGELRKSGELNHEFDIPVDLEQYFELGKHFSEERVDKRYDGEWVHFEDYLGALSDVVKTEDQEAMQILSQYL